MFFKVNSHIKLHGMHKKKTSKLKVNKSSLELINMYVKLGIINSFKSQGSEVIIKYNYRNGFMVYKNLVNFHKPSQLKIITLKYLKQLNKKRHSLLILSTSQGILTSNEALKKKTGGIIIAALYV